MLQRFPKDYFKCAIFDDCIPLVGKGNFRVENECFTAKRTFPASDQGQDSINYIFSKDEKYSGPCFMEFE